jgi:DNA invertase Pin-like site-specific DNA recombinase
VTNLKIQTYPDEGTAGDTVVAYVRVSSDAQAEHGVSLDAQEAELRRAIARDLPRTDIVVLRDEGFSAWGNKTRPAFAEMLDLIEGGRLSAIYAHAQDRLSRKAGEWHVLLNLCRENGVRLFTLDGGEVGFSADDDLIAGVKALLAERESAAKSHRVRSSIAHLREQGLWRGGPPPLGYRRGADRILVKTTEAPHIADAFCLFDEGELGVRAVSRFLTERIGCEVSRHQAHYILRNPTYAGKIAVGVTQGRGRPRERVIEGLHKPIVTVEVFDSVQRRLDESAAADARHSVRNTFGRVARCGICKSALRFKRTRTNGQERTYYQCEKRGCVTNSAPTESFEATVVFALAGVRYTLEERLEDETWEVAFPNTHELVAARRELNDVDAAISRVVALVASGDLRESDAREALNGKYAEQAHLRPLVASLEAGGISRREALEALRDELRGLDRYAHARDRIAGISAIPFWMYGTREKRQAFINRVVDRIELFPADPTRPLDARCDYRLAHLWVSFRAGIHLPLKLLPARRDQVHSPALRELGFGRTADLVW